MFLVGELEKARSSFFIAVMKLVSVKVRRAALVFALLSCIILIFVLAAPYWRWTYRWNTVAAMTSTWFYEGLFLSCLTQGQGYSQCQNLPSSPGMDGNYNTNYYGYIYCKYSESSHKRQSFSKQVKSC